MSAAPAALYLCLDQGGHSSRALVLDAFGAEHGRTSLPIDTQRDGPRVEHDPEQLVETLRSCARHVLAELGNAAAHVVAAGLATQRSSIVCWDRRDGRALSPVLSWQDTRAAAWLDKFAGEWQRVHGITGLALSPHYGVSKLVWCMEHLPDVQAALREQRLCCGPLAAFLARRLTGGTQDRADPANASRTLLWDRRTRDWSPSLLQLFGIDAACLPQAVDSRAAWGNLQLENGGGAAVTASGIPLTVVTGDQSAALFAFGTPKPGTIFANLGTGAFVQQAVADPAADSGRLLASTVYRDARSTTTVIEGTVNGAGSALTAIAGRRGISKATLHENSARWLEEVSSPPLFLNSLAGLGSPWWQSDLPADFAGHVPDDAAACVAVMESIIFLLAVNLRELHRLAGPAEVIVVTGGLAGVDPLLQRLADISGKPVKRASVHEATATGLGFLLVGLPREWPVMTAERTFLPADNPALQRRFQQWQALMPPVPR